MKEVKPGSDYNNVGMCATVYHCFKEGTYVGTFWSKKEADAWKVRNREGFKCHVSSKTLENSLSFVNDNI